VDWLLPPAGGADDPPYWDIAPHAFETRMIPLRAIYQLRQDRRLHKVSFSAGPLGVERLSGAGLRPFHGKSMAALSSRTSVLRLHAAAASAATIRYIDLPLRDLMEIEQAAKTILLECECPGTI
jgi:hypothetical protein